MASFPIFRNLRVEKYGLFPGTENKPGLQIEFKPGLTLVLGANGLGKTTLVTMLYRLCTGPADIPGLGTGTELGVRSLKTRKLRASEARMFAARVADGAADAEADLEFGLGESTLSIRRSMATLELLGFSADGDEVAPTEEEFQKTICDRAGVASYGDWILLLRHLTFYFEDRRALVWDPTAQRQILRFLFLSPAVAARWTKLEREIVARDSEMRNLRAVVGRQEQTIADSEEAASIDKSVRAQLRKLEKRQAKEQTELDERNAEITSLDSERQAARLAALKAEAKQESAYRDLERRQLTAVAAAFPSANETARYLLTQLAGSGECLACGSHVPNLESELRKRAQNHHCVICGSRVRSGGRSKTPSARSITNANKALERAGDHLEAAVAERKRTEEAFQAAVEKIASLSASIAQRQTEIEALIKRLPPDAATLRKQRKELGILRGRIETMRADLNNRRASFRRFIRGVNDEIVERKDEVQKVFTRYAAGFLLDTATLAWRPHKSQLGEEGGQIDFPAFELEMGGADFPSPVRRTGPEQVSESQREFIDLAFRMTLMQVAGSEHVGSLVIDAPESSLDAVFVTRAADVLSRFASPDEDNRLVVTSNLVEGNLIPELSRRAGIRSPGSHRVVDLFSVATPTTATRELQTEYAEVRDRLFKPRRRRGRPV